MPIPKVFVHFDTFASLTTFALLVLLLLSFSFYFALLG